MSKRFYKVFLFMAEKNKEKDWDSILNQLDGDDSSPNEEVVTVKSADDDDEDEDEIDLNELDPVVESKSKKNNNVIIAGLGGFVVLAFGSVFAYQYVNSGVDNGIPVAALNKSADATGYPVKQNEPSVSVVETPSQPTVQTGQQALLSIDTGLKKNEDNPAQPRVEVKEQVVHSEKVVTGGELHANGYETNVETPVENKEKLSISVSENNNTALVGSVDTTSDTKVNLKGDSFPIKNDASINDNDELIQTFMGKIDSIAEQQSKYIGTIQELKEKVSKLEGDLEKSLKTEVTEVVKTKEVVVDQKENKGINGVRLTGVHITSTSEDKKMSIVTSYRNKSPKLSVLVTGEKVYAGDSIGYLVVESISDDGLKVNLSKGYFIDGVLETYTKEEPVKATFKPVVKPMVKVEEKKPLLSEKPSEGSLSSKSLGIKPNKIKAGWKLNAVDDSGFLIQDPQGKWYKITKGQVFNQSGVIGVVGGIDKSGNLVIGDHIITPSI